MDKRGGENGSIKISKYLDNFLSKKRSVQLLPMTEIEDSNDYFLRLFVDSSKMNENKNCANNFKNISLRKDELGEDGEEEEEEGLVQSDENISISSETKDELEKLKLLNKQSVLSEVDLTKDDEDNLLKLKIYNLPYKISQEEVSDFGIKFGVQFNTISLDIDNKTNKPLGSATVEVLIKPPDITLSSVIQKLNGESCGGRNVRVQRLQKNRNRMSLNSQLNSNQRYFGTDISSKCSICGEVGHKQNDCDKQDLLSNICHLCAGKDHDAGICPNLICYRCGLFGHHSKECRNTPMSRATICTLCGLNTHDARQCPFLSNKNKDLRDSRIEGGGIKCMNCGKLGHAMCQKLIEESKNNIYCPNCGEPGHNINLIDFSSDSRGIFPKFCPSPRYEAFIKYPQLLSEMKYNSMSKRNDFYRDLIRGRFSDLSLFPSLSKSMILNNDRYRSPPIRDRERGGVKDDKNRIENYSRERKRNREISPPENTRSKKRGLDKSYNEKFSNKSRHIRMT